MRNSISIFTLLMLSICIKSLYIHIGTHSTGVDYLLYGVIALFVLKAVEIVMYVVRGGVV
jgi:hypothetical protein